MTLAALRCLGAALFLLPILLLRGHGQALRAHWRAIAWVGVVNSALPFSLYGVALLAINAGLSAIFNAATPLWTAAIGALWLRERLGCNACAGAGHRAAPASLGLAWSKAGLHGQRTRRQRRAGDRGLPRGDRARTATAATSRRSICPACRRWRWPRAASCRRRCCSRCRRGWLRPAALPSTTAWVALALLAVLCTGVAYILYFRLIARIGATNASAVTFLIPAFAAVFGWLFLGEATHAWR